MILYKKTVPFGILFLVSMALRQNPGARAQGETVSHGAKTNNVKFDLKGYFKSKMPALNKAMLAATQSTMPQTKKICKSMEYSLMAGGKRLRPIICIAACEMFGGTLEDAIPTAIALEMIHTMSLIHDDLPMMDNDDLRRGKPTNHIVYGEEVAILAGDAMLSAAFEVVAKNTSKKIPAERVLKVIGILGNVMGPSGLPGGQLMDLMSEGKEGVTVEDLTWIHIHKTAILLESAICCGAILGGATEEEIQALRKFAINTGLAFQIADDILDITATTEELGKTAAKDLDADKTTYPKLIGLEESKKEAQRLIDEAKALMEPFGDRAIPLLAIADFIVNRKN